MILKRKFHIIYTWLLLFSLSTHFFFFHGIFDFNVICFEKDGSTNIEYSIDGKNCIDHSSRLNDNVVSFAAPENKECNDVSLTELNHNDDQFIIKKIDESNFIIGNEHQVLFDELLFISLLSRFATRVSILPQVFNAVSARF